MAKILGKISLLLFLIFALMSPTFLVYANTSQGTNYIEDNNNYLTKEEKKLIEDEIKRLPETYRIIILPTINGSVEDVGQAFFQHRNLSPDTILILVLMDDKKIYAFTDEELKNKGLDDKFFEEEIQKYFVSSAKTKSIPESLIDLIRGISSDIPKYLLSEKDSPKIPDPPNSMLSVDDNKMNSSDMSRVIYTISGVAIIFVIGYIFSKSGKKNYK